MRAYHVAALFSAFLVLWFLADACAHAVIAPPEAPKQTAWTLAPEADDSELFCVIIGRDPRYDPSAWGLHCARVGDVRMWLAHLKYAH